MVNMPPRHGKTVALSRVLPAWWLGSFPTSQVILASYGASLAHSNSAAARDLLRAHGEATWGVKIRPDLARAEEWGTTAGGICKAVGVGGGIVGRGGDLVVIDDPVKDAEEAHSELIREKTWDWYQQTLRTRLEPGAVILCVMTRWHEDDLGGRILAHAKKAGDPWHVIRLSAIAREGDPLGRAPGEALWPKRVPLSELLTTKEDVGPYTWASQFDQDPHAPGTNEFPEEAFADDRWWSTPPRGGELRVMACDPSLGKDSKKGDLSAIVLVTLAQGELWVEADIERRPAKKIVLDLLRLGGRFKPHGIGIETNMWQELLKDQTLSAAKALGLPPPNIYGINNFTAKALRIRRLEPTLSAMRVRWRDTEGTRLLVSQLRSFPSAKHDDGPDAMEMAQRLLIALHAGGTPVDGQTQRVSSLFG